MGNTPIGAESRRQRRIAVGLETRIRGTDRYGLPIDETAISSNVSRGGCSLETAREVVVGAELEITIDRRIPGRTTATPFLTRGVVMRVSQVQPDLYSIGIQFTGPHFPTYSSEEATSGPR